MSELCFYHFDPPPVKKRTVMRIVLGLAGLALSFYLALAGIGLEYKYGIRTPGIRAAEAYAQSMPPWQGLNAMSEQVLIDSVFWFALLVALYILVTKLWNRKRSKASR
jgi:hypothetical protein